MSFMVKVKAIKLREKGRADLLQQLEELKKELSQLRIAQVNGGQPAKLAKIKTIRKSIATVLTVISQHARSEVAKLFADKKHKPLDLREKKTRAIRRRLTAAESSKKTLKQQKKDKHFSRRKVYALKA